MSHVTTSVPNKTNPSELAGPAPSFHCAFCGRDNRSVGKMVAGPGVAICDRCIGECVAVLDRNSSTDPHFDPIHGDKGAFGAWTTLDDATLLAAVRSGDEMLRALRSIQHDQIHVLRSRGTRWTIIGEALGTSRQAAWERFGKDVD